MRRDRRRVGHWRRERRMIIDALRARAPWAGDDVTHVPAESVQIRASRDGRRGLAVFGLVDVAISQF